MVQLPRVSFLVIGAQKCGTTTLDACLRQHPQIQMAAQKELHFFDNEALFSRARPPWSQLDAHFDPDNNRPRICGEATPIYLYWRPARDRILRYNPRMKFIVLLRNPVDRAYSHWKMEYARGSEKLAFDDAIAAELESLRRNPAYQHRVRSYVARGYYFQQLRRFWDVFPHSQFLIMRSEYFWQKPAACLNQVWRHLGVADTPEVRVPHAMQGGAGSAMGASVARHLSEMYSQDQARLHHVAGAGFADAP